MFRFVTAAALSMLLSIEGAYGKPVVPPGFEAAVDGIIKQSLAQAPAAQGFAVAAVLDGDVIFKKAYGTQGLNDPTPASTKTNWHWASVSKSFTAIAVMILYEDGKLNLDDPVVKHVPYFKMLTDGEATLLTPEKTSSYKTMTVKQLLTHSSGIGDVKDHYNFMGWPYKRGVDGF